ncbi:hypothetical protein GCM10011322_39470 [Salinarimonas ramus]|uniref:DUF433 domain-containing protein n=1 Tax=Salinarimonas ramus TaxID=690164 RepID=A0A917V8C1_9HYPH|nr:hypothetical protein GCM10011322_39470 [Salinarimonas ramus]
MAAMLSVNEVAALADAPRSVVEKALEQRIFSATRSGTRAERMLPIRSVALAATFRSLGRRLTIADKLQMSRHVETVRLDAMRECRIEIAPALTVDVGALASDAVDRALRYAEARDAYIERVDGVMGGRPVLKGTRITASSVLGRIEAGDTIDDLLDDYPDVPREAFEAAYLYAATHPSVGRPARERGAA